MPSVTIKEDLYEELMSEKGSVSERVNEILRTYLGYQRDYESPNIVSELEYGMYLEHGNAD